MAFFNREKEIAKIKAILSKEPNVIWFFYGPINSGKTALITKVINELSEDYRVFYINFRGFEGGYEKFIKTMFEVGDEGLWQKIRAKAPIISAALDYVEKVTKKINTSIELPVEVIKMLYTGSMEPEKVDVFSYLEKLMKRFKEKGFKPILIFDELQVIKEEINATGMPLLARLFNFFIRMTKETHLCHCLCLTSDSLFIEEIYRNAHLEGRMRSFLVDDLDKESAFKMYDAFGFEQKELIWDYIGGKIGDMVLFFEEKKIGLSEAEIAKAMLRDTAEKIDALLERVEFGNVRINFSGKEEKIEIKKLRKVLEIFKDKGEVEKREIEPVYRDYLIKENVLFFDPTKGIVRPQGRLIWKAIKEVVRRF